MSIPPAMYLYVEEFFKKHLFSILLLDDIYLFYKIFGPDHIFIEPLDLSDSERMEKNEQRHVWLATFISLCFQVKLYANDIDINSRGFPQKTATGDFPFFSIIKTSFCPMDRFRATWELNSTSWYLNPSN